MTDLIDPPLYYRLHLFACTNKRADDHPRGSCAALGSEALRDHFKKAAHAAGLKDIRINGAGCLDRCELGPVVVIYPDGIWYKVENKADVEEIVESHLKNGQRVSRLILSPQDGPAKA